MLTLTFQHSHASIASFPTASLPDFTLITGPNGVGKTHLLQAIHKGYIKTDVAPNQNIQSQSEIRIFDWSTMIPQDTGVFSSETIRNERQDLLSHVNNLRLQHRDWDEPVKAIIRQYGLGREYLENPSLILTEDRSGIKPGLANDRSVDFAREITEALRNFQSVILNNLDEDRRFRLEAASQSGGTPFYFLSDREILSPSVPTWGQINLFQQSFARLFVSYRDLQLSNILAQFQASKGFSFKFLSEDEFSSRHGTPPWDFVNKSLDEAGLDFSINIPTLTDYAPFEPKLTKKSTGVEIPFSSLSSGEKVLMSFAFCLYYSNDKRQISVRPKIILFDEIDAPLHPSMSKNIIGTMTNILVGALGIKVIATTHSPSTVAIAPEESVFVMRQNDPGLHKVSRASALNILTVGVPTLAISYDGRRQVFVESQNDAEIYDSLYVLMKSKSQSERSLEFVATGTKSYTGSDINMGCENVKRLVSKLREYGNISVFGLLDWDGKNDPTDLISILSYGSKNGIENVILNPLAIGLLICRDFPDRRSMISISSETSYFDICHYDRDGLQIISDSVAKIIFPGSVSKKELIHYLNGVEISVDARCLLTDDHEYEEMILSCFPFLNAIVRGGKPIRLIQHIITRIMNDSPFLIPTDIKDVFDELLKKDSHV